MQPLWRYLKYERLIQLLSTESLYFRQLSLMNDQWEGLLTRKTKNWLFEHFYAKYQSATTANQEIAEYEKHREEFHINCWHMNDAESYLMWKVYSDRGCAIESTFERMQISFDQFPGEIEGTVVKYLDFMRDEIPVGNIYHAAASKSLPYREEKEFRLLFWQYSSANQAIPTGSGGVIVKVDLNKLISKIWLSPQFAGTRSEIEGLIRQKNLDCDIRSSSINES